MHVDDADALAEEWRGAAIDFVEPQDLSGASTRDRIKIPTGTSSLRVTASAVGLPGGLADPASAPRASSYAPSSLGCSGESLGLGRRKGPGYRRRRGTGSRSRRGEPCTIASFTSPDSSVRHAASRTGRATVATEDSRGQGIRPRLLLSECSRNHWHKGDAGHSLQSAKTWARHPCKARRDTPLG
jgi:hypothetical protein